MTLERTTADREQLVSEAFIGLADTLVDDYDVIDLLDRLVRASTQLLGADEAGLLLDDQGTLAVVATSSEDSRLLEVLQLQSDQGPCLECVRSRTPLDVPDLAAEQARWPLFVPAALAVEVRAVFAVPLRLRDVTIGGLNLFRRSVGPMAPEDRRLAQALAHVATIGILQQRSLTRSGRLASELQHALDSRVLIEQAKGVLAERHELDMNGAYEVLRRHARDHNLKLAELAAAVVTGDVSPGAR